LDSFRWFGREDETSGTSHATGKLTKKRYVIDRRPRPTGPSVVSAAMSQEQPTEASGFEQHPYVPPPDSVEIIVVRHGASEAARPGVTFPLVDGQGDPALSEVGKDQAQLVARELADEQFSGVFVSTLRRTQETAAPLVAEIGLEPKVLADLREVNLGELEGGEYRIKVAEGDPLVAEITERERWDVIPGAESPEEFEGRLRTAIETIAASVPAGTVAVAFAHGAVIGQLCAMATGSRPFAFINADNGSISRLVVHEDGNWLLRSFNETRHLDQPTGPVG
jgi:2,3-bisphosphoglycerate-dependent phosphoglycerate mutase